MYHFIGIKGTGMSSLAQILKNLGYEVKGSDISEHCFTDDALNQAGIYALPFDKENIKENDIIIRGNSFTAENNEEVKRAEALDLKMYAYEEMVGKLTRMFDTITIAGCHGKTTTSSMLAHTLKNICGCNYLIGDGTGYASKENKYFVLEACEYKRHFLSYTPTYAVITNIDLDHVDYFKDIDDVILAYQEYANKAEKMVIACGDDPYTHSLEVNPPIFYYGLDEDNDIVAKNVEYKKEGTSFEVFVEGNYYGSFDLPFYGKHMLLNALAVIAICSYERMDAKEVSKVLKTFGGAKRRFQENHIGTVITIDDYAHHPAEVKATMKAAKQKYPDRPVVAVFEPYTYARVLEFADDYAKALNLADYAYVMDIKNDRDNPEDYPNVTSDMIIKDLEHGDHIGMEDVSKLLKHENPVVIFMSPKNIYHICEAYEKLIEEGSE
ncbi:MAG: UDP-N-acetylmuramate--L-alanine ligase [Firmicutes bacterium]|nr:UDP-N-acetylmuramate--L-alanine ligase [Bacillota bacterium]